MPDNPFRRLRFTATGCADLRFCNLRRIQVHFPRYRLAEIITRLDPNSALDSRINFQLLRRQILLGGHPEISKPESTLTGGAIPMEGYLRALEWVGISWRSSWMD